MVNKINTIINIYVTASDDEYTLLDIHEEFAKAVDGTTTFIGSGPNGIILHNEQKLFFTAVKAFIEDPSSYNRNNLVSIISMARNLQDYTSNGTKGSNLVPFSIDSKIKPIDVVKTLLPINDKLILAHIYAVLIVLSV